MTRVEEEIEYETTEREYVEVEVPAVETRTEGIRVCDNCGSEASGGAEFEITEITDELAEYLELHMDPDDLLEDEPRLHLCAGCFEHGPGTALQGVDLLVHNSIDVDGTPEEHRGRANRQAVVVIASALLVLGLAVLEPFVLVGGVLGFVSAWWLSAFHDNKMVAELKES